MTLIELSWNNGKWEYRTEIEDISLAIKDIIGDTKELVQLTANEAQKMLGVWLAHDRKNKNEIEEMRKQTVVWAEKVRTGAFDRRCIWQAITLTIMK